MKHGSKREPTGAQLQRGGDDYEPVLTGVVALLDTARRASARVVNSLMTASYWDIGRRIVEHEQSGKARAGYGEEFVKRIWLRDRWRSLTAATGGAGGSRGVV